VSDFVTALTGAGTTVAVGVVMVARSLAPSRHRTAHLLPSEEVLCGPPSPYTAVDPDADTQVFGVIRTGFGWCEDCRNTTAGVITRNGFRCGEFSEHLKPGGAAA
jgi:hypothetical protein